MSITRRSTFALTAGLVAAPTVVRAQTPLKWRMVTSWPKNLPGPGVSARRVTERIAAMSGGRLTVDLFAAGEIVPAFEVFDAVAGGAAEMAHTAAFYWQGKLPGAVFFTTVPFGLGPIEHLAWIQLGGGQALWDELYRASGLRGFLAGNTGANMGGWFRKEIRDLDDLKGLRIRVQGPGGEVYRRLGATPVAVPPGEITASLMSGAIDAVEFLAPSSDLASGFHRATSFYYAPGFNKPNGAGECLVSLKAYEALPADLRAIVAEACFAEHAAALADAERLNAEALTVLTSRFNVKVVTFPDAVLKAARDAATETLADVGRTSPLAGRIAESYAAAKERGKAWGALQGSMNAALARV
jgi:TRAP-type mannitol/chloroaromatic compound transport system substrate-binding protein